MKVLKFGGTSVGSAESIKCVVDIIKQYNDQNQKIGAVASAMAGVTNTLIETGDLAAGNDERYLQNLKDLETKHFQTIKELLKIKNQSSVLAQIKKLTNELEELMHGVFLLKEISTRTLDLILSFGERLSCQIINAYAQQEGLDTEVLDARKLIKTDDRFGKARIKKDITFKNIQDYFSEHSGIQVITGFISSTEKGETTTLGRGGSDYTAAIFGAALGAEEIEIWTDVDGVLTTDPKKVKKAFSLNELTYVEAMEMSHFGAKVIYPPTLQPAFEKRIPLRIRNTFNPDFKGTVIREKAEKGDYLIKGISSIEGISLISLQGSGMVGVAGVSSRLFTALAENDISVIMITQASSEHSICIAVNPKEAQKAKKIIDSEFRAEIKTGKVEEALIEEDLSIVAIIGENMRNTPGIAGKMFDAMGKNGINVSAIAQGSSEVNLSIVISTKDLSKALNSVHEVFFLSDVKTLNVFLVGVGLIGGTLLKQIRSQYKHLLNDQMLNINVVALANSRKMIFNPDGIKLGNWKEQLLSSSEKSDMKQFIKKMKELNLSNSIFADCTSSPDVVGFYEEILGNSISITTPNKLAGSGPYSRFKKLKDTAFKNGIKYLYETNVGAGLPVITTLNDLMQSGDKVLKIEGVLSGTLSYIFNNFKKGSKFSEVVKTAKEKGFTEPDPRDDLNGMDVARKILILAREVGYDLELKDVKIENILPESCLKAPSVNDFFVELEKDNDHFEDLLTKANAENKVLRFIAKMENGKATVSLQSVDIQNPFYSLSGSDNMISFSTDRYSERPLVIKGPGAGAEVTAAGVFAEIISLGHFLG